MRGVRHAVRADNLGTVGVVQPLPPSPAPGSWEPPSHGSNATPLDVGGFEQGTQFSRWALARYLVGRAIGESVGRSLLGTALVAVALAVVSTWVLHLTFLAVLLVVFAVAVLILWAGLRAVLRRLTAVRAYAPVEERLKTLVSDTHHDVLRELRRIGLPGHTLTLPLLAIRLAGKRRTETVTRLRGFEVERAVPGARIDELHMLLRTAVGR